ncbi:MAG: sigma-70 family RNA polymerase sigma factor [Myxococcota bacterium]
MRTDAELLTAWREGDEGAAATLIDRYAARLHRFFDARVGGHADDLCQQTLEACVQGRASIDVDGQRRSYRAYLFGIARHKLLDHYRSQRSRDDRLDPLEVSVADLAPSASQHAAANEEARLVAAALRRLPIDYQMTLELHYWDGMTTAEISEATETPVGTVKTRLTRGRRKLKKLIATLALDEASREAALERTDELARELGRGA